MALLRHTPWTQQPQSACEIDWANPITKGLVSAYPVINLAARDVVGNRHVTGVDEPTRYSVGVRSSGVGLVGDGSSTAAAKGARTSSLLPVNGIGEFSAAFVVTLDNVTSSEENIIFRCTTDGATNGVAISVFPSTGRVRPLVNTNGTNGWSAGYDESFGTFPTRVPIFIGFSYKSGQRWTVVKPFSSAASTFLRTEITGAITTAGSGGPVYFGGSSFFTGDSYPAFNGAVHSAALFFRALPIAELVALSQNPWQIFKPIPRRIFVPVSAGAGPQDLYPNLFTNDQTFYSHTLSQSGGTQTLTHSLYTNDQTFYTHTLSATKTLTPSLYTNSQDFYGPTLSATKALTATLHTNSSTFYGPSISAGTVTLTPGLFTNSQSFYAPVVQLDGGPQYIAPDLYTGSQTFYGATVQPGAVAITPSLYNNSQTFYSLTVTTTKTLTASLYTNDHTFYAPVVSLAGGTQYVEPSLHTNVESFFSATVSTGAVQLYPALFTNTQTFYTAAIGHVVTPDDPEIVLLSSPLTRTATLTSILR